MVISSFLDPFLLPFLKLSPAVALFLIAFLLSLVLTIVYKYTTDQNMLKELKEKMKVLQKEVRAEKDPKKALEKNKEMMEINMKIMRQSMKSTLYTFLPLIFVFGWLAGHFAYAPLLPGEPVTVIVEGASSVTVQPSEGLVVLNTTQEEGKTMLKVKAENPGEYLLFIDADGKKIPKKIIVSERYGYYEPPVKQEGDVKISTIMEPLKPLGDFSLFGWHPGWLGTYIIFSLILSMTLRKLMKVV